MPYPGVRNSCELPRGCWLGVETGPLEELAVLLTCVLSLQRFSFSFSLSIDTGSHHVAQAAL